ncbi:MAG: hypothetical protein Q9226_002553 [Calogaya cf. arnoldii]
MSDDTIWAIGQSLGDHVANYKLLQNLNGKKRKRIYPCAHIARVDANAAIFSILRMLVTALITYTQLKTITNAQGKSIGARAPGTGLTVAPETLNWLCFFIFSQLYCVSTPLHP